MPLKITRWTLDKCSEVSKNCISRKDFKDKYPGAYETSRQHKWLDNFTWLEDRRFDLFSDKIDSVYKYYFKETNSIYVGRTLIRRQKDRDREHIFDITDTVHLHAKENNLAVPEMEILESNLSIKEGAEKEGYWKNYFLNLGFNILNKAKTGGLGGIGKGKWSKAKCTFEAKKYKTLKDFREKSPRAYDVSCRKEWISDFSWLERKNRKPNGYWTLDRCKEVAKLCKNKTDLENTYNGAYCACFRNNWFGQLIYNLK